MRFVETSCRFWVRTIVNTAWDLLEVEFILVAATVLKIKIKKHTCLQNFKKNFHNFFYSYRLKVLSDGSNFYLSTPYYIFIYEIKFYRYFGILQKAKSYIK